MWLVWVSLPIWSRPVLVGYMTGVAVLMVLSQLDRLTGLAVEGATPVAEIRFVLSHLSDVVGREPRRTAGGVHLVPMTCAGVTPRSLRDLVP